MVHALRCRVDGAPMTVILRDYQHEAVKATRAAWDGGMQRPAVVMPTGSGKTVPIAELARLALDEGSASRVLVLAHRDEMLRQAKDEIHSVAPNLRVGVVKSTENGVGAPVVVEVMGSCLVEDVPYGRAGRPRPRVWWGTGPSAC